MTKNELIEAINSTIVANGQKGITAESLNLILNELVNSGGGTGGVTFYVSSIDTSTEIPTVTVTEERKAHNAEIFQIVKNAEQFPPVMVDMSDYYSANMGMPARMALSSNVVGYIPAEAAELMGISNECIALETADMSLQVSPDGSIIMMMP